MTRSLLAILAFSSAAVAGEVSIALPPETSAFKQASGVELMNANCLLCHSADYVPTQPRMARKFWEATIKKMREKYHAPIAEEAVPPLLDYLVANYGAAEKK